MHKHNSLHILRVDSSAQREQSITRKLGSEVDARVAKLEAG